MKETLNGLRDYYPLKALSFVSVPLSARLRMML